MATAGIDCDVTLQHTAVNGGLPVGFLLRTNGPKAFCCTWTRVRSYAYIADGGLAYSDRGPGKREWRMTIPAIRGLVDHRQAAVTAGPAEIRGLLREFYEVTNSALTFADPAGEIWAARLDSWREVMPNLPSAEWEIEITLLEE